jgi:SAM-dependent methyltransferase
MDDYLKKTIAVYDKIADDYAKGVLAYTPEIEREKFTTLVKKEGSILDVGCAAGRDSEYFSHKGFHVTGIDLSKNLLKRAKQKSLKIDFQIQDVRTLHFPNYSFDGIFACAVLLHLKRLEIFPVFQSFHRILKDGGILFVMMKRGKGEVDIREELSSDESRHFTLVEKNEISQWMCDTGFSIIELYTWKSQDRWPEGRDVEWISCFAKKVE